MHTFDCGGCFNRSTQCGSKISLEMRIRIKEFHLAHDIRIHFVVSLVKGDLVVSAGEMETARSAGADRAWSHAEELMKETV